MSVKLPFFDRNYDIVQTTFLGLLKNAICPHFQTLSITSLLLSLCLLVFIVMHIVYPPGGYSTFLQMPTQMNVWALDIQAFVKNKAKFYTLVTAMFVHYSYRHIIVNMIFGVLLLSCLSS